jgi:hypothetical protein
MAECQMASSLSIPMLGGSNNPTLARDTMFAVVMIVLNGMVGLTLLLGALRHGEQRYNLQGANAYLSVVPGLPDADLRALSRAADAPASRADGPGVPPDDAAAA